MFTYHGLGERSCQGEEKSVEPPAAVNGGVHHISRVEGVGGHPVGREAPVQLVGEQDIAELGAVVGQHSPVFLLGWRKEAEIQLSRGVFNFCKSEKQ